MARRSVCTSYKVKLKNEKSELVTTVLCDKCISGFPIDLNTFYTTMYPMNFLICKSELFHTPKINLEFLSFLIQLILSDQSTEGSALSEEFIVIEDDLK